ncbi:sugar ABC transporter ATP-binding protein [Paenarthrobacter sp. NPDC057981]|uniref:sugar ABC transporter ATP-binding protein n=1 Tax=Paenarthrobacter sp. NPDC057981 TaxID=3346297 RepID=UPI0036D782D2
MPQLLTATGIRKSYGATMALSAADITVDSGHVVALLGANGSGKSTLTRILTGAASSNGGEIIFDSAAFTPRSPQAAQRAGIAAVAQELSLVPGMTIAQNIWLGARRELPKGKGLAHRQNAGAAEMLNLFSGFYRDSVTPRTLVSDLSPDESQIVEILKAVARKPKLLILDEATSTLDRSQVARLSSLIEEWCQDGMGVIFVSHRMDEVFSIAHQVCVVRGGKTVLSAPIEDVTRESVVSSMTGSAEGLVTHSEWSSNIDIVKPGKSILEVQGVGASGVLPTTFTLHQGEIVGLGGLQRQGQTALLRVIAGQSSEPVGTILIDGKQLLPLSPSEAMDRGIQYVGGDRSELAFKPRPISENLLASAFRGLSWVLPKKKTEAVAAEWATRLQVKSAGLSAPISSLSGGNAQKVLLARALVNEPRVIVLDDPTKGVDVMTKRHIYAVLRELLAEGIGVLLYSSEDEELLELANRVLVFHDGAVVAELAGPSLNKQALVAASMGVREESEL